MGSVTYKPLMLSDFMLNVVMMSVVMLNFVALSYGTCTIKHFFQYLDKLQCLFIVYRFRPSLTFASNSRANPYGVPFVTPL